MSHQKTCGSSAIDCGSKTHTFPRRPLAWRVSSRTSRLLDVATTSPGAHRMREMTQHVVLPARGPAITVHTSSNDDHRLRRSLTALPIGSPKASTSVLTRRLALARTDFSLMPLVSLLRPVRRAASSPLSRRPPPARARRGSSTTARTRAPAAPTHTHMPVVATTRPRAIAPTRSMGLPGTGVPVAHDQTRTPRVSDTPAQVPTTMPQNVSTVDGFQVRISSPRLITRPSPRTGPPRQLGPTSSSSPPRAPAPQETVGG